MSRPALALLPYPPRDRGAAPVVDIVIPVYNEAAGLAGSIVTLRDYLLAHFPFSWRITIADNASTDGTWLLAQSLAATLTGVNAIHLDEKGRGRALRHVWSASDAEVLVYMDVDLSTRLDALLPLVAPIVSGHSEVAIGSRLAPGAAVARGPRRELISRTYNGILHAVFANRFRDAQCGFKAVQADVARALLPAIEDETWFFDTELLLLAERNGLRIHEVPVTWVDDPDSRVHVTKTAKDDLRGVARMARRFWRGGGRVDVEAAPGRNPADDFGRRYVTFGIIGAVSTAISLALFLVLRGPLGAVAANAVAVCSTAVANTWAHRRTSVGRATAAHRARHYLGALGVVAGGLALSTAALSVAGGWLAAQLVALALTWTATTLARFALVRRWASA
jgi:glycosyltransferase involved in cell wall biosynthesis